MRYDDRTSFLRSLVAELDAQAARVRNLIGDHHWGCDGQHKESLLVAFLAPRLPAACAVSRGFVVLPTDARQCSREQDILIVDRLCQAPLFDQGSLIITAPDSLFGAVSVKTSFNLNSLKDACAGLISLAPILAAAQTKSEPWLGVYFFDVRASLNVPKAAKQIECLLRQKIDEFAKIPVGCELCLRTSPDSFFKIAFLEDRICLQWYETSGLATAVFLARLTHHIARTRANIPVALTDFVDNETSDQVSGQPVVEIPLRRF